MSDPASVWAAVLEATTGTKNFHAQLKDARLVSINQEIAVVESNGPTGNMVADRLDQLRTLLRRATGLGVEVEFRRVKQTPSTGNGESQPNPPSQPQGPSVTPPEEQPLVKEAMELFGAKVVHMVAKTKPQGE